MSDDWDLLSTGAGTDPVSRAINDGGLATPTRDDHTPRRTTTSQDGQRHKPGSPTGKATAKAALRRYIAGNRAGATPALEAWVKRSKERNDALRNSETEVQSHDRNAW